MDIYDMEHEHIRNMIHETDNKIKESLMRAVILGKAINALEQEPCNDTIRRADLDEIKELMTDISGETVYAVKMSEIRKMPPVYPVDESVDESKGSVDERVDDCISRQCEKMTFPNSFDEYAEKYGFKDSQEVYTNGSVLISVFRVKQWLEHLKEKQSCEALEQEPCDDCISRREAIYIVEEYGIGGEDWVQRKDCKELLEKLSPVQSEQRKGKWIYDGDQIICNRCNTAFTFMSLKTATRYCANCGAKMQEVEE